MKELMLDIQEEIQFSILSFKDIARKYNVPYSRVQEAWDELCLLESELYNSEERL
jgi:hypothetical protein